jgi:hypothetical protein
MAPIGGCIPLLARVCWGGEPRECPSGFVWKTNRGEVLLQIEIVLSRLVYDSHVPSFRRRFVR